MTFRARIRSSLANSSLQAALDANAERRVQGRVTAFASLPDWRERRQRAHAVRAEVIAHLDEHLEQFIAKAKENHVTVHRAANADEAIRAVIEITNYQLRAAQHAGPDMADEHRLLDHQPRNILVAKSKSMVSEEINLNHALEREGPSTSSGRRIRVVETDLGEYIVQLRNERPAHIITPAVHLRRGDVGQLFHEKLGIPYTEDIPTLTNTARKVLREVFLTADIGISGVNFGIAETGGICIVTNEGNGRMVTTLPQTHIALMGMERLVPTLDDLALMLSLLPRSATGQKLSVYTQILHSPLEGQQRHIVILDNGRTRLRNSPLAESLYCIRCGACLNACPVFRELGGHAYGSVYPGPIGSVISAGLFGSEFVPLAQASSLCGACKDACPVDIDLPKLLTRVRAGQSPSTFGRGARGEGLSPSSRFFMQIYSRIARDPRLFAVSQRLAAAESHLVSPRSHMFRIPAFTGWGYSKDFPRFAVKPFRARFEKETESNVSRLRREPEHPTSGPTGVLREDVGLHKTDFTTELTALGGQVIPTGNPTRDIVAFLKSRGVNHIHLEPNILDESALAYANITSTSIPDPAIRVGVTRAICGLADTGSILEADGEGNPLHASLLPEVHIAVLKRSDILPSLEDAVNLVRGTKSAVFITGPSRTADIEMTLTIGVHGPGELHVFLVDG
ncbi:MAG: LUD domain-containing protein [Chloroflexi bacterium]|nr:LUD domain-containing protein [Chloroflexota bacterium]